MSPDALAHWEKFRPRDLLVREFDSWLVVVRSKQVTLGDVVFLLKRATPSLAQVTPAEAAELPRVAAWFEKTTQELFGAERFNYLAAMMKDPYVHLHVFPRYGFSQKRYRLSWADESWPKAIELRDVDTPEPVLLALRDELRGT